MSAVQPVNPVMRGAILAYNWVSSPIGPPDRWPQSLRTVLSLALDTPFAMMIMWGPDLVQLYNDGYIPILGDKHPRSIGQKAAECWADIWDSVGPMLLGVLHRGEPVYHENLLLPMTRGGRVEDAFFTFSYSPIRDGDGIGGLICVVDETTASVLREREAGERAAALAELDRSKTQFFNNISHEFRTPLTLMLGPLEDLTRTLPDAEQRRMAEVARRNAVRLQKLVNTLLDFSLVQSGGAAAALAPVAVEELTRDLVSEFRSAYDAAGLQLRFEAFGTGGPLLVDPTMYEKVVLNLLSNALKFTFRGGVTVTTAREGATFVLRVRDTGIGIAPEDIGTLFERFRRVEGARSRTYEGSGIGLALVRELVGLHGGSIDVQSTVGAGTTFSVVLPLRLAPAGAQATSSPDTSALRQGFREDAETFTRALPQTATYGNAGGPRILLADDNADLREYVCRLLGARFACEAVADGQALLERVQAQRPDLVVADVMMPRMDGFAVLRALRENHDTADIPIVLLSARAGSEAAAEALAAGADDYVVKPFVAADLLARIEALLRRAGGHRALPEDAAARIAERRETELLSAAADRFIAAVDSVDVARAITSVLTPGYAAWSVVYVPQADGTLRTLDVAHEETAKVELSLMLATEYPVRLGDGSSLARCIAEKRAVVLERIDDTDLRATAHDERHYTILSSLNLYSAITVPVVLNAAVVAAIQVVRDAAAFTTRDVAFMERVAARAALAFESARAYERERTIASTLQRALLPGTMPVIPGLRFSASYTPAAQESLIGGDWYDAFTTADGAVMVAIGDVVGHGIGAASVMASLRQAMRSFALENADPAAILTKLNTLLVNDPPGQLATALVARIEPQTLVMTLASAGHYGPFRVRADGGEAQLLPVDGVVLGAMGESVYRARTTSLDPGDLLALFTDGYVENERDLERGEARLAGALRQARNEPDAAARVHLAIFGSEQPRDDAALLTIVAEPTLPSLAVRFPARPEAARGARTALRRFFDGTTLPVERREEMLVAAGEAIINVIEHAYRDDADPQIFLTAARTAGEAVVEIEDFGGWLAADDSEHQRGYGLPLMHAFADTVEIQRSAHGTRVRLTAKLRRPAAATAAR